MLAQPVPERLDAFPAQRLREHDRRLPVALMVESEDRPDVRHHRLRGRMVRLVDRDHVRDLHDPRLQRLDRVARAGHEDEQHRVRHPRHLDLALAGADRLHEDDVLAGRVEQQQRLQRRLGEAAEVAARAHRADEDARVEEVIREPDPVAEQRPLRERARRIDGDDAGRLPEAPRVADERSDEARLADPGRPRDADRTRALRCPGRGRGRCRRRAASPFSTSEIARASARRSPSPIPATSALARPVPPAGHALSSAPRPADVALGRIRARPSGAGGSRRAPRGRRRRPRSTNTQRAPTASVNGPATIIPSPSSAKFVLMITVNTRPRNSSGAPRWTSSEL